MTNSITQLFVDIIQAFDNSETSVWRSTSKLYSGLRGISLEKFMTCGHNPATNRMVNMLADHRLMGEQCEGEGMSTEQIEHRSVLIGGFNGSC